MSKFHNNCLTKKVEALQRRFQEVLLSPLPPLPQHPASNFKRPLRALWLSPQLWFPSVEWMA